MGVQIALAPFPSEEGFFGLVKENPLAALRKARIDMLS